jgi:hypothetical protein
MTNAAAALMNTAPRHANHSPEDVIGAAFTASWIRLLTSEQQSDRDRHRHGDRMRDA